MIHLNVANSLVEQTGFKELKHRYGVLLGMKHLFIDYVGFRHPFSLLPDELMPLIVKQSLNIPPDVYSYLLQLLCSHYMYLGDYRGNITRCIILNLQSEKILYSR